MMKRMKFLHNKECCTFHIVPRKDAKVCDLITIGIFKD